MADNDNKDGQDFASVLITHDKGRVHTEASKKMTEAVAAVLETGKGATVTLKIKVSPVKDLEAVKLEAKVDATIPREPSRSIWYADDDSKLHRNDPKQYSMFGDEEVKRHTSETPADK